VRLWDLSAGVAISTSKAHGGTVRCVALDETMAVSGCADNDLRIWASTWGSCGGDDTCSTSGGFDLSSPTLSIKEHTGPISSLCLTDQALYSGSWDCTVRCFSRHSSDFLHLGAVYQYNDCESASPALMSTCVHLPSSSLCSNSRFGSTIGVNAVAARGKHLLVAAGSEVFCQDLGTGQVGHLHGLQDPSLRSDLNASSCVPHPSISI
jgi:WD40 repeat protein